MKCIYKRCPNEAIKDSNYCKEHQPRMHRMLASEDWPEPEAAAEECAEAPAEESAADE